VVSTIDGLFEGEMVVAVPTAASEYARKAPGAYDSQGDHCKNGV
jgi:hypothetical protein